MQINIQTIPGYAISEYLLVLSPPEELRNKVLQVKKDFYQSYKANSALGGKAYLPLASFSQFAMIEERLINRLKTIAMGYHPFKVELKNFGSFPSHSIYIQVISKDPVRKLVK